MLIFLLTAFACTTAMAQYTTRTRSDYLPGIFGILKTKFEYDPDNSLMRFE